MVAELDVACCVLSAARVLLLKLVQTWVWFEPAVSVCEEPLPPMKMLSMTSSSPLRPVRPTVTVVF